MGIINPTPGELLDRLAILQIKIQRARSKNLPYQHFMTEQDQIWKRLGEQVGRLGPDVISIAMSLSQVHIELWNVVEEQNKLSGAKSHAEQLLNQLQSLNARRVELRESIDKLIGMYNGPEKIPS